MPASPGIRTEIRREMLGVRGPAILLRGGPADGQVVFPAENTPTYRVPIMLDFSSALAFHSGDGSPAFPGPHEVAIYERTGRVAGIASHSGTVQAGELWSAVRQRLGDDDVAVYEFYPPSAPHWVATQEQAREPQVREALNDHLIREVNRREDARFFFGSSHDVGVSGPSIGESAEEDARAGDPVI